MAEGIPSCMYSDLMAATWCLYHQIHCSDPPPQHAREQQAAFVLTRMRQTVLVLGCRG
jgi:hypothetical protein